MSRTTTTIATCQLQHPTSSDKEVQTEKHAPSKCLPAWIWHQIITLFYFTKSDIKTTIIPVTIFATSASPNTTVTDLLQSILWTWLHLLQFDISNQIIGIEEDKLNKPDRPLASGRIGIKAARRLRLALVPICIAYSAMVYSVRVAEASIGIALLTAAYNELGLHAGHWMARNLSIALDYGFFELGATYVAGRNKDRVDEAAICSVLLSVSILAATYHVQDFKDHDGDKLIGRKTFPIVMPTLARWSILLALPAWSIIACALWNLQPLESAVVCGLGIYIGVRFYSMRDRRSDQVSFYYYNLWLTVIHCLVGIWRYRSNIREY